MNRESGNCQADSAKGTDAARFTRGQQCHIELISDWRACRLAVYVRYWPTAHECGVACDPSVQRVPLLVSDYTGWRDRTNPARRPLPRADCAGVIHADRFVLLDDLSAAVGGLPFERVAGQGFGNGALPDKAPKLFFALGAFAGLNPSRHYFQLVPGAGGSAITILSQKVRPII